MYSTVAGFTRRCFPFIGASLIVLAVGLAGCQKKTPPTTEKGTSTSTPAPAPAPSTPSAASTPTPPAVGPQEDKVVATVNGTNLTESQVQKRIDARYKPILAKLAQQSPQLAAQQERILGQKLANDMINEMLLDEQVRQAGIQVTDAEFQAEMVKQLAAQNPPMTVEQLQNALTAQGFDFQTWKDYNLRSMKYDKLVQEKVIGAINVTDAEVKKYYDENGKEFLLPERVRASHILISTRPLDPNTDPNQLKVQAKQKAEELLKKAKGGADFAALAKENSEDPGSKAQGGDLGLFPRGQMVKPFEDAAFGLQIGEISNLIETQFGYHIIKVTEKKQAGIPELSEVQTNLTEFLKNQKVDAELQKVVEGLRAASKIELLIPAPPQLNLGPPTASNPRP